MLLVMAIKLLACLEVSVEMWLCLYDLYDDMFLIKKNNFTTFFRSRIKKVHKTLNFFSILPSIIYC